MNPRLAAFFRNKRIILFFCGLLLLCWLASSVSSFKTAFFESFRNPLSILAFVRREIGGIIFYHRNLTFRVRYEHEIGQLRQQLFSLQEVERENKRLKNFLSLKQDSAYSSVAARVIARSPDNWSSVIIVDKGSRSGIRTGMAVINYDGLVGRIIETSPSTSKVILLNDASFSVSCITQRSRQEGLISGSLGSALIMKYIAKEADITINDTVITSGFTETYPKGIPVGKIVEVNEEFSGLALYALVRPTANLTALEEVLIIVNK